MVVLLQQKYFYSWLLKIRVFRGSLNNNIIFTKDETTNFLAMNEGNLLESRKLASTTIRNFIVIVIRLKMYCIFLQCMKIKDK